jgi:hypothetical protein
VAGATVEDLLSLSPTSHDPLPTPTRSRIQLCAILKQLFEEVTEERIGSGIKSYS